MRYLDWTIKHKHGSNDIALIQDERELSYKQLNNYSMKMQKILEQSAIPNASNIAIYMDKSIEAIISIYGALFHGSAYIPIDYSLPKDRVEFVITNSEAKVVITNREGVKKFQQRSDILIICIEKFNQKTHCKQEGIVCWDGEYEEYDANDFNIINNSDKNDLAYIIYTSGSSGIPKGVMIPQNSIMTFVNDIEKIMEYDYTTRFLNVAPLYFDACVLDLFCIFNVGGTVVLLKKFMFPRELLTALESYKITDTLLVSSVLKLLTTKYSKIDSYNLSYLKTIWYGAEGCSVEALRFIKEKLPHIKFIHGYGPTESTHTTLLYRFENIPENIIGYMPIGKALPSVYVYALNDKGEKIKQGEQGELYIGGSQLMLGYCANEVKNKEVLLKDIDDSSKIVYKTGDIVTLDEDWNYWYIGRNDDMIKCGGNLVHLSEIEKVLLTFDAVKDAIAFPVDDEIFNNKIYACVVIKDGYNYNLDELRAKIADELPAYMMPSQINCITNDQIPRKDSGKIDKKALKELFL